MNDGPRQLASYDLQPQVEYRMFVVHDPQEDPLAAGAPGPEQLLLPGPGGVVVGSAGNDFYPTVTLEVWDGEPPPDSAAWEGVEDADLHLPSGHVQVESVLSGYASRKLPVGEPGTYRIRAHCRGRDEARRRIGQAMLYYYGVEEWLLRVWPTGGRR
jgi:hypothetical protein